MLRLLCAEDLPALTYLCKVGMEHDEFFDALVREKTLGARDYEAELCLGDEGPDGRLRGFIIGVQGRRRDIPWGYVRLLVVNPAHRNQGVGSALLAELESRLKARGARRMSIMDVSANYLSPGVDPLYTEATCFLPKNGYKFVRVNENLICDLPAVPYDCAERIKALESEGFFIRRATPADRDVIVRFLEGQWPDWVCEVLSSLELNPPMVHICLREGEVVAFAGAEGNNRGTGWFGPMGTHPVTRGKGIGAITLQLCLNDLAALGHRHAIIPWVGPVRFYSRFCGSRRHRTFWTYEKELA